MTDPVLDEREGIRPDTLAPLWSVRSLSKQFPGVLALKGVDIDLYPGRIHALVGENGCGKSTLIKVFSGVHQPESGQVLLNGQPVKLSSPRESRALGVATIYQEFSLVGSLSVAENIAIGSMPRTAFKTLDRKAMRDDASRALELLDVRIDPSRTVASLSVAEQQIVEIAKAVIAESSLLILDEPTTALSTSEVDRLHHLLTRLRTPDRAILYVSHRLEELAGIADELTVLRNGEVIKNFDAGEKPSMSMVVQAMVGRPIAQFYQKDANVRDELALDVRNIHSARVRSGVSLTINRGEVLGFAGVIGSGRTEVARAIFGADPIVSGTIRVRGRDIHVETPSKAIRHGIGFVPENRKTEGLFFNLSPVFNITVAGLRKIAAGGWLNRRKERQLGLDLFDQFRVSAHADRSTVQQLSGGNQQKLLLARWVFSGVDVLLLDEPTQGIDIGARQEVYRIINELTRAGVAILLISSDMPELLAMSDRVAIIRRGQVVRVEPAQNLTQLQLTELIAASTDEEKS